MKKIILSLISMAFLGCSKDDNCQDKINEINTYFDSTIQRVKDKPIQGEINQTQIDLLNEERSLKLKSACK